MILDHKMINASILIRGVGGGMQLSRDWIRSKVKPEENEWARWKWWELETRYLNEDIRHGQLILNKDNQ